MRPATVLIPVQSEPSVQSARSCGKHCMSQPMPHCFRRNRRSAFVFPLTRTTEAASGRSKVPVTDSREAFVRLSVAGLASCDRSKGGGNYNAGSVTSDKIVNLTRFSYPLSEEKKQWARASQLSMQIIFVCRAGRSQHTTACHTSFIARKAWRAACDLRHPGG